MLRLFSNPASCIFYTFHISASTKNEVLKKFSLRKFLDLICAFAKVNKIIYVIYLNHVNRMIQGNYVL